MQTVGIQHSTWEYGDKLPFSTTNTAECSQVGVDNPRWQPKLKTAWCPRLLHGVVGFLAHQQLHRLEQSSHLPCAWDRTTKVTLPTKPEQLWCYHLPSKVPVSGTSCPPPCCLNMECVLGTWRRQTNNSNLKLHYTSARNFLELMLTAITELQIS